MALRNSEAQSGSLPETWKDPGVQRLLRLAAILSICALLAHSIDAPDHLTEWWGFAAFSVTAGAFQFFYGFLLLLRPWEYDEIGGVRANPDRYGLPSYILGLVLASSVVVLFVVTRTVGMPFLGPAAGVERVTLLSLVPIALDLPVIYCLGEALFRTRSVAAAPVDHTSDEPSVDSRRAAG